MNNGLTESLKSASDLRWWKADRSASEIGQRLERFQADKEAIERRIADLLEENKTLKSRCTAAAEELAEERHRLKAQIAGLKSQVSEALARTPEMAGSGGRQIAESSTRERLLKDECERKLQSLQMELNRERQQHAKQIRALKEKNLGCICGEFRIEHIPQTSTPSSGLPERWVIRNSR